MDDRHSRASCWNTATAAAKCRIASTEVTWAAWDMAEKHKIWAGQMGPSYGLLLLEVLFDELSFSKQVRDKLLVGFGESVESFHVADELF